MKRTGFKSKAPERKPAAPPKPLGRRVREAVIRDTAAPIVKDAPFRSEAWLKAVRGLPCMRCFIEGQSQAAHRNEGKGMGTKTDDSLTAALCQPCHAEIDQGAGMTRQERREALDVAILMTLRALARRGLVRPA